MSATLRKISPWSIGFAMFAMFFGAGNIVFPLALGQHTLDKSPWGIVGLMITAVLVPLVGLFGMLLYEGNYQQYFRRIGKVPGFLVVTMILALIGPFAGIPRCITISYSTLTAFGVQHLPGVNLVTFSLVNSLLIFLFAYRPGKILSLIGNVLTPILLLSLGVIMVKGLFFGMPHPELCDLTRTKTFFTGMTEGYNTMDLLASFFFSSVVLASLRKEGKGVGSLKKALIGGGIAAGLLTLVYASFSLLAASYSGALAHAQGQELLGALAYRVLGPHAGMVVGVTVFFACLTTEIALTAVFARFVHETVLKEKISYPVALAGTLFVSFLVSTLNFGGIATFLTPILKLCYPALIVLALMNIVHKFTKYKVVKPFFYGALILTILVNLI